MNNWLKFETPCFVYIGPFMNSDGITVNTGLSLSQGDIFLTRNGGAFFSLVDASAIVHSMLGYYRIPLGSTDLGSTGRLKIVCNKATALPVWETWSVVTSKVYDSLITASDNLEVDTVLIEGTDATNQVRDSIVDDATRIDASALNTLSSHDPGEAIAGTTDTMAANITQIGGVVQSLTDLKDFVDTGYDPTTHKVQGVVLTDTATTTTTATTVTNMVSANVTQISGDSTAADNAELFFDGTGYNAANSAIGTVATATAVTTVNGLANDVITAASVDDDGSFVIGALSITNQLDAGNVLVDTTTAVTGEVSIGNGVVVTCSTAGKSAAKLTGGATSGIGIEVIGTGTGQGIISTGGGTSGSGVAIVGGSPNGVGLYVRGDGAGTGFRADGGDGDGVGVLVNGGATNGNAVTLIKAGSGYDVDADIHGTIDTTTTATNVTTVNGLANAVITAASIATGAIDSDAMAASANEEIADAVWDEVLTAATHNVASSAGRRLRTLDSNEMRAGTCQAGSTANTIRLDAAASATDGWYDPAIVIIDGGTGAGQCRLVIDYVGASQTCIVNRDWRLTPDITSTFIVVADAGLDCINEGQAAGGAASSITLNTHAKNISDTYNGCTVVLTSGTGRGQSRVITDYDGGTKVALVSEAWTTQPIAGTGYYIFGIGRAHLIPDSLNDVRDAIVDDATRIDASALNTLSSHDPGEAIMGATDTVTASVTSIANDAITAASIATDAIGSDALALTAIDEIVDATWNELIAGHTGAGSTGLALSSASAPTVDQIADAVWNELIAGHLLAGSTGLALNSASAPTADQVADAVWNEDATGHVAANSTGNYLRTAYALATGRLKIDDVAKQLILYMPDGTTEIARWNIYNSAGALASTNVFDRQRT